MKMEKRVIIELEKCKSCELCIYFCPKKSLGKLKKVNALGYYPVDEVVPGVCNSCGICYLMCPEYAIKIKK
ncbi:MAG: 4Fe-4S binding protein [Elusimicrobiota bacterium]